MIEIIRKSKMRNEVVAIFRSICAVFNRLLSRSVGLLGMAVFAFENQHGSDFLKRRMSPCRLKWSSQGEMSCANVYLLQGKHQLEFQSVGLRQKSMKETLCLCCIKQVSLILLCEDRNEETQQPRKWLVL